jgi:hypothetical protein
MLFTPLFVVAWLIPHEGAPPRLTGVVEIVLLAILGLSAASSVDWFGDGAINDCRSGEVSVDFYWTDCRAETGGGVVTSRPKATYVDPTAVYLYAGCRPTFIAGPAVGRDGHDVKMGTARAGLDALADVSREPRFGAGAGDLTIICDRKQTSDPACAAMRAAGKCQPSGTAVDRCTMSAADREAVLKRAGK